MHNKRDVLLMARELFSQQGYHGTGMRQLAKSLQMREATLYVHIVSKEEILWNIINETANAFLLQAQAISCDLPIDEQMKQFVYGHLKLIVRHKEAVTVFFNEWRFLSQERQEIIKQCRDAYEACLQRVIEEGHHAGFWSVADARLATLILLGALNWTYHWIDPVGRLSVEQVAEKYLAFIMHTLKTECL